MSDDSDNGLFLFGDLFGDDVPAGNNAGQAMNGAPPVAPPLLGPNGSTFVVPPHLKNSIIVGSGQDAPVQELDSFSSRFPIPLLRRALSFSKNTPASLHGRLADLSAEQITVEHAHNVRLMELETSMRSERLSHAERTGRIERERIAIEKALAQIAKNEAEAAASTAVAATSSSSRSPSCLSTSRSPGECHITGEETGCGVCLSADRDTLVAPCGHVAMCFACADAIRKSRNPECPFCRSKITAVYKLFVV